MTRTRELVTGDTAPLTGSVGMAVVGATGESHIAWAGGAVTVHPVTWTDTATGAWSLEWDDPIPDNPGTARVEVQVTFSDGSVQTVGPTTLYVRREIA